MKSNVQFEDVMIFKKDFGNRSAYSLGVSGKKYVNGQTTDEKITAYLNVQFARGNAPEHKDRIDIIKSFLAPYPDKNGDVQIKLVVLEWQPYMEDSFC